MAIANMINDRVYNINRSADLYLRASRINRLSELYLIGTKRSCMNRD